MPQAQLIQSLALGGVSIQPPPLLRTFDHPNPYEIALPVAHALSSWVKTDANTAAGNLGSGHGLSTGTFDIYWDGGQRLGVTCTITTNAVALEGGSGTDFPASANTTVRMAPIVAINAAIDGDAVQIFGVMLTSLDTTAVGHVDFSDSDSVVFAHDVACNDPLIVDVAGGATNPLTGDPIESATASQSSTTQPGTLKILSGEDSTP